jgi:hypothetical protein
LQAIAQKGFDERHAYIGGMFGAGIYFAGTVLPVVNYNTNQFYLVAGKLLTCYTFKNDMDY